jgi:hypothetical protein
MSRFITRHMGLPVPVAVIVAREIGGLRNSFTGVTIVAAFNAVVVGLGALILGVPLAGTIAVVTFLTAYVPFIGAWVAGIFAFVLALGSQGATDAVIIGLVVLLANGLLYRVASPRLDEPSHRQSRRHARPRARRPTDDHRLSWRARRRSWRCSRSVSHRDPAWAVTSSHWRRTSSSAGRSPRRMRPSSSSILRPAAAEPTTTTMTQNSAEIIANTAPITP